MALPLARRTMAERFRANYWSFLTGVGPKVIQCGCHASCVSSSPALSPRAGAWTITRQCGWLSSCRGAIAVVVTLKCVECPNPPACQCATSLCQSMFGQPEHALAKRHWTHRAQPGSPSCVNAAKVSCLTTALPFRRRWGLGIATLVK